MNTRADLYTETNQTMSRFAHPTGRSIRFLAAVIVGCACMVLAGFGAAPARAAFGVASFDGQITDQSGDAYTQAGGHPFAATTTIDLNQTTDSQGNPVPDGSLRNIVVGLPAGLVGDPSATPTRCTEDQLEAGGDIQALATCPASSQVGTTSVDFQGLGPLQQPVYNMVPPRGLPAQFGFKIATAIVHLDPTIRTGGDYGLTIHVNDISQALPIMGTTLTFWGVPADPAHDGERGACLGPFAPTGQLCPTDAPRKPFLTLPTACTAPGVGLETTLHVNSWEGASDDSSFFSHLPPGLPNPGPQQAPTGCDRLDFSPSITVQPTSHSADSPTGLHVDLALPQNDNPDGLAEANLKDTVVTLPAGVSVNPSAANGLAACSPSEIDLHGAGPAQCPDSAKVGAVEIDTPLVDHPLTGGIYVATQNSNPFGSLLAIYVAVDDPQTGVVIKLAGHVVANPVTGQLSTTFEDNPQLPFSDFKLDFFGGPRAALATPGQCGTYTTHSSLSPWSGTPPVSLSDTFTVNSGCASGFSPTFTAGVENPQAGRYSPFVLSFSRSDTDQDLSGVTVNLPPGMLAKLAGVQQCTDTQLAAAAARTGAAEQANPSCPAGSQVGTVTTGAGTGPDPFFLSGNAYLTGPYKGAPYGLAVVVPAVAGPYDLGTVVVRQALYIDPTTAQVTAVSDAFPTILDGIPLRLRRVSVTLDRSGFMVNPTSCNPMSVIGTLTSAGGMSSNVSSRFQVGGCSSLGFSPKLKIALSGKGKTRSGDHPTLTATLTDPSGQSNIRQAKVALPLSLALDPNNSQHVCDYQVAQAVHGGAVGCPASTIVGQASAVTPLLSQPLSGPVFLVQGIRFGAGGERIHTLPSLLIPLRGQIALDLRAQSAVSGGRLVTTFSTIPDAPVSKFTLKVNGGLKGILVITGRGKTICGKKQVSNATVGAQSGKRDSMSVKMSKPCPAVKHKKVKPKKRGKAKKHAVMSLVADRLR